MLFREFFVKGILGLFVIQGVMGIHPDDDGTTIFPDDVPEVIAWIGKAIRPRDRFDAFAVPAVDLKRYSSEFRREGDTMSDIIGPFVPLPTPSDINIRVGNVSKQTGLHAIDEIVRVSFRTEFGP